MLPVLALGALAGAASGVFGGRKAIAAQNALNASNFQFQQQMALWEGQFNAEQAAVNREWQSGEADEARAWEAAQAGIARDWNAAQAGVSRDFNAQQAQLNRDFEERMRATQYQTAVGDMQAAGLNPMLAYSQGGAGNLGGATASSSPASTSAPGTSIPSGSTASASGKSGVGSQHFANYIGPAVSSALEAASTIASLDKVAADTEVSRNQALNILADTALRGAQGKKTSAEAISAEVASRVDSYGEGYRKYGEELKKNILQNEDFYTFQRGQKEQAESHIWREDEAKARAYGEYYRSPAGHAEPYLRAGVDLVGDIAGAFASSAFGLRALGGGRGLGGLRR